MLSIISITLSYMIGIIGGLFLEFDILILALLFCLFIIFVLDVHFYKCKKIYILFFISIVGIFFSKYHMILFNTKYIDGEIKDNFTIISSVSCTKYYDKYYAKNSHHDKFILYFRKNANSSFQIGNQVEIKGIFQCPGTSRNSKRI